VVLSTSATSGDSVVAEKGVKVGEQVVIDGLDKLRDGGKVELITGDPAAAASGPRGARRGRREHAASQAS